MCVCIYIYIGWGAAGGSWRGGVEEAGGRVKEEEEEFTYDWYTVGGPEEVEGEGAHGLDGLGGRGGQVYGSGAQKVLKSNST